MKADGRKVHKAERIFPSWCKGVGTLDIKVLKMPGWHSGFRHPTRYHIEPESPEDQRVPVVKCFLFESRALKLFLVADEYLVNQYGHAIPLILNHCYRMQWTGPPSKSGRLQIIKELPPKAP